MSEKEEAKVTVVLKNGFEIYGDNLGGGYNSSARKGFVELRGRALIVEIAESEISHIIYRKDLLP